MSDPIALLRAAIDRMQQLQGEVQSLVSDARDSNEDALGIMSVATESSGNDAASGAISALAEIDDLLDQARGKSRFAVEQAEAFASTL